MKPTSLKQEGGVWLKSSRLISSASHQGSIGVRSQCLPMSQRGMVTWLMSLTWDFVVLQQYVDACDTHAKHAVLVEFL